MSIKILQCDCRLTLATLPEKSVHCCVTSPPYWGLRDYGCDGQIGLEKTLEQYVAAMVGVFREIRRVLRDDGTLWLNVGDSYASHPGQRNPTDAAGSLKQLSNNGSIRTGSRSAAGCKPKDLIGIPWMLAFALRADGWYLRSDIVWAKPNGMPESVQDRPTRAHEYVFLLSKSERYFYDYDAARLPPLPSSIARLEQHIENQTGSARANGGAKTNGTMKAVGGKQRDHSQQQAGGAALRDVWWISPAQCKEAHFAAMPDALARLCIMAGCPPGGTVLDPFGGSGTTGIAASLLGRNAILCELSEKYIEIMRARFAETAPLLMEATT